MLYTLSACSAAQSMLKSCLLHDFAGASTYDVCRLLHRSMGRHRPVALVSRLNSNPAAARASGGSSSGGEGTDGATTRAGIK